MSDGASRVSGHTNQKDNPVHAAIILHGIGQPQRQLEPGEETFWVSLEMFEMCLDEIVAMGPQAPEITFDDGNASDIDIALPALQERNLKATFFLLAGRLDQTGSLTSADVTALADAGHRIGLHGFDHVDWSRLDTGGRMKEFETARARLATLAGQAINTAAAPFGFYNRQTVQDLSALGFRALYTSDRGLADRQQFIRPRNCLEGAMSRDALRAALRGEVPPARRLRRLAGLARKRFLPLRVRR